MMGAIEDGSILAQLLSLRVAERFDIPSLLQRLKAGCLPRLVELGRTRGEYEGDLGPMLAETLKARRALDLPSLTRLEGFGVHGITDLRRIWGCCPARAVARLEVRGEDQVAACSNVKGRHVQRPQVACA